MEFRGFDKRPLRSLCCSLRDDDNDDEFDLLGVKGGGLGLLLGFVLFVTVFFSRLLLSSFREKAAELLLVVITRLDAEFSPPPP